MNDLSTAVVYQVASRALDYPDEQLLADLPMMRAALREVPASYTAPLGHLLDHIEATPLQSLAADYVATFDLRRRCCLYLSYYAYGDTRKRGIALLAFKQTFRRGKVELKSNELPDHLCVVLEFAATADLARGTKMLLEHALAVHPVGARVQRARRLPVAALRGLPQQGRPPRRPRRTTRLGKGVSRLGAFRLTERTQLHPNGA